MFVTLDTVPSPVKCENSACGKVVNCRHDAINYMFVVGSPGHPSLMPFQCPSGEHWACSIECWEIVAHACIREHALEMLKQLHAGLQQ